MASHGQTHAVRLVVSDDLRRSRLTVFFRLLLVIPHFLHQRGAHEPEEPTG